MACFFQQDGAPPHVTGTIQSLLDKIFRNHRLADVIQQVGQEDHTG